MIQQRLKQLLASMALLVCIQGYAAPKVVVSIQPLHALVQAVMGEVGVAKLLVRGNASPHGYALRPSELRAIHRADLVFFIAPEFEVFLDDALANTPKTVRSVPMINHPQLERLATRSGGVWEAHDHAHVSESEALEESHDHHHHSKNKAPQKAMMAQDMHVWLSPQNAQHMLTTIAQALSEVDPANSQMYLQNAKQEQAVISRMDVEIKKLLDPVSRQPFIVFHDAYQYFEEHYGLKGVASITLEPNEASSVRRIQQIRKKIESAKVGCVFTESQFSDKLIRTVLADDSVRIQNIDPLGFELAQASKGRMPSYTEIMHKLAQDFLTCLQ